MRDHRPNWRSSADSPRGSHQDQRFKNTGAAQTLKLGSIDHRYPARWLSDEENPTSVPLCDCRGFALVQTMPHRTREELERFKESRHSSGVAIAKQAIELLTAGNLETIRVELVVPPAQRDLRAIGPVFRENNKGILWEIHRVGNKLAIVRSFEQTIEYIVDFEMPPSGSIVIDQAHLMRSWLRKEPTLFHFRALEYILYSHFAGITVPHPVPEEAGDRPEDIARFSYLNFGERGSFAFRSAATPAETGVIAEFITEQAEINRPRAKLGDVGTEIHHLIKGLREDA